ncbi:MAG: hypothetical protein A2900_01210 [Candidatus Chisholmbacteria bacterium RIFCSPLOWO2_01_FULL_50_28]|uniref:Uncharacterized protein n=1 Tax=Candidatus Chisholmbacteria bacterium RIFCSPHIGHO2_01_FULL_52_32 TaxID=1797591 RepID=A0A1G1VUQ8_9BACT|nr:MAG: hypothetical protein A2786_06270 [Candidatus Chisholmbacteria bacterium RIFCSPHIGHO2_01_FULL_52_32]OGY19707.1 MAG: hypothetical protein A2900_01210 [Candidatus Chisholmbacteria bacterium RIFCSPLOWO2_01_FULL_50_28]
MKAILVKVNRRSPIIHAFIKTALDRKGEMLVRVISKSMTPTVQKDDVVVVVPVKHILVPGNILLFKEEGNLFLHRYIISIGRNLLLKGDSSNRLNAVSRKQIIGKAMRSLDKSGRVKTEFNTFPYIISSFVNSIIVLRKYFFAKISVKIQNQILKANKHIIVCL